MKEEDQQIAIAEACGFEWWHCPTSGIEIDRYGQLLKLCGHEWAGWKRGKNPKLPGFPVWHQTYVPDYIHDLNAMHEAESTLPPRHEEYAIALAGLMECNEEGELNPWDLWEVSHATAAQRAEAFLRTIGKWKD